MKNCKHDFSEWIEAMDNHLCFEGWYCRHCGMWEEAFYVERERQWKMLKKGGADEKKL